MCKEVHRELGISAVVPEGTGRDVELNRETNDGTVGVRLVHSSLRLGKPTTWRRD